MASTEALKKSNRTNSTPTRKGDEALTDTQAQWLYDYIRLLADKMALKDWGFDIVTEEPQDPTFIACIMPVYGRKYAQIHVRGDLFTSNSELQRHILVHELVHCHTSQVQNWIDEIGKEGEITAASYRAFRLHLEVGVDGLADALAPFLLLPPSCPTLT